ncbi:MULTISPECIES: 4-hydroxybenzoate 3-monooxygenase [unclassified Arthrobacter]|uniref:4-hydroxybenzoate 3-monooxygenase n=1 Tax=unclassified Arthrobacter TaxID=235627 RepID=UPI001E3D3B87|nr:MULTISPECIES: 4-hydroxybenzoate 3-monooxygenase [unclassified Arthrobacter]MCC9144876.1 4-hydroxybenzoate 3-monooxygenase [Arthrobacter sp. zg-Y919]MDK1276102.1 4-hydroxybenzoate 3-monooxygenase [Arthrobacter sp. zg.Y919]WIB02556.1 4-hydroxybenzoate 3-monooxygenase [Arthrobacter sp. zg-Y919]
MGAERTILTTQVGIVGGGPAGLMLSHLLSKSGIDNIVVEKRDHETIRTTHRAGILEHGSVRMLTETGVSDRVLTDGYRHEGIDLRFGGESHRIDFEDLVGESVWLYPQNEVFTDLAAARERDHGDVRYGVSDTAVTDLATDTPKILFTDSEGRDFEIHCGILVGSDGSGGICKRSIPREARTDNFIEYPFAWFGILTEAAPSAPELIYANSDRGFALISQRNDKIQRMYFQADPNEDADAWSEERIWDELQARVDGPDGLELKRGPIFEKTVLKFRSYVCEPMRYGNLFLAGDAGHTVPPTGAKGLNLALADVQVLFEAIDSFYATRSPDLLDGYSSKALQRVWRAQNFSYWMTSMLHTRADASPFERKRALGELSGVVASRHGSAYLAEAYTGWPNS